MLADLFYTLSVSYTHLDVYKRQKYNVPFHFIFKLLLLSETETERYIDSVSYTHLDVYKRQIIKQ